MGKGDPRNPQTLVQHEQSVSKSEACLVDRVLASPRQNL